MLHGSIWGWPSVLRKIDEALVKVEGKITAVNTKGIIDGFSSELPGLTY